MAENINGALITGQQICWDESHGYYLRNGSGKGELNPDVDCSYFVGYCLQQNGFSVSPSWYTGSMITTLSAYPGFSHYIWSPGFQWRHGDIAVYDEGGGRRGHTFFYAENVRGYNATSGNWDTADGTTSLLSRAIIEASSSRGWVDPDTDEPIPGDQDNGHGLHPEVWVHQYTDPSSAHTWHIFRWDAGPGPGPIPLTFEQQIALYSTLNRRRKDESIRYKVFY